jgi:hypothetical protein
MAETRLWQAVILRTIQEWLCGPLGAKRNAELYLFDDNSDFAEVCQSAGMDVNQLRMRLAPLRKQHAQEFPGRSVV